MKNFLKLSKRGLILVTVPLLFELLFVGVLIFSLERTEHEIWKERHSKAVISESNALLKSFLDTGISLYMYGTTNSESALERFKELQLQIPEQVSQLKALVRNSSNQEAAYGRIIKIGNRASELLAQGSDIIADRSSSKRMSESREALESLLSNLTGELKSFVKEQEKSEQIDPQAEANSRLFVIFCLGFGITINVAVAIALAIYYKRSSRTADNADLLKQ